MKLFKDWTKFEIIFLFGGTILALLLTPLFKGTVIDLVYTLLYFWTALLLAKGKYSCYIIGIISTFFYSYVSYTNSYFGEVIISMCCTLPLMIIGLINWLKHQDSTNTVIIKEITKKELILVLLSQLVLFYGYYYLLKIFNTSNLIVSSLSIVASLIATYLTARRSEYGFIGFIINDLILIVLWGTLVIQGNLSIIPVLLCPVLLLINDIYGAYNWKKLKNIQNNNYLVRKTLFFSNIKGDIRSNRDDVSFNKYMEEYLIKNIDSSYNLMFIEAPGLGKEENYFPNIIRCFKKINIIFKSVIDIDIKTTKDEVNTFLKENDKYIIFLMGGNPITQKEIIDNLELNELIKEHKYLVIGFCAGAINLSKYSIITSDDDFEVPSSYLGINRENICIEPHYNKEDDKNRNKEIKDFCKKYKTKIYGIPDESMLVVENSKINEYGKIYCFEEDKYE